MESVVNWGIRGGGSVLDLPVGIIGEAGNPELDHLVDGDRGGPCESTRSLPFVPRIPF